MTFLVATAAAPSVPLIILLAVALLSGVGFFAYKSIKVSEEEKARRIPGPDEICIPEGGNAEVHVPTKGDFYIRDNRNDSNPFEMFNVYRIDEIRTNVYGDEWVKYTAPGYGNDYTPKWKELECPLDSFLKGKIRVVKIKK